MVMVYTNVGMESKKLIIEQLNKIPKEKRYLFLSKLKSLNYDLGSMKIMAEIMK
uniref:Uncharacterized protein n=1 Tax=Pyramimonas orientalis virus TaxID=455367 RepID=A0A7M3UNS1_POV01|nr:hypothetical protein HWQ62_00215 [Pyramimonas orientalis virus]